MNIIAFFSLYGTPQTGLSPTVRIRIVSTNALVVTDAAMTEVGDGFYKYSFSEFDKTVEYSIRCDGGATLAGAERYPVAITSGYGEVLSVKEQTDKIAFTTANQVDARVRSQDNIDFGALQKASLSAATPVVTVSDKTGFSLSATGADLILKSSTFIQAIVAAINELATYGLTALNALLVTTGIKAASVPALVQADVRSAVGLTAANLDTQLADIPTIAEFNARTIVSANYATAANLATVDTVVDAIKLKTDQINAGGALIWTYTVTDSVSGLPISDVTVRLTSDSAGTITLRTGITNTAGIATFYFNPADSGMTVYVFCTKSGYNFPVDQEVIN